MKLAPEWALVHFVVAGSRLAQSQSERARAALQVGRRLDGDHWMGFYAQGYLDGNDKKWAPAIENFENCLRRKAEPWDIHYLLATALFWQGDLARARREYRTYLLGPADRHLAEEARTSIANINNQLGHYPER